MNTSNSSIARIGVSIASLISETMKFDKTNKTTNFYQERKTNDAYQSAIIKQTVV